MSGSIPGFPDAGGTTVALLPVSDPRAGAQALQVEKDARSAATKTLITGAVAGAAAGAAAGSIVPGIGTLIGAGVGAIAGSIPGILGLMPSLEGGSSHGRRLSVFDQSIERDAQSIPGAVQVVQGAQVQVGRFQQLAGAAQSSGASPPALAAAEASAQDLSDKANALVADVNAYSSGKAQINPWHDTDAGTALGRIPGRVAAAQAALAASTSANDALAQALGVNA